MQSELTFLFTTIMPLLLVSMSIYVCFSIAACTASKCSQRVDRLFASKLSKSFPFAVITLLVLMFR